MFPAPFTLGQPASKHRLVTLGWTQFIVLAAGLCLMGVVLGVALYVRQ